MARKKRGRKLAVIDFETDPFLHGRVPRPFCCEFYSDEISEQFWGDDCAEQLVNFLEKLPDKYLIYAHNGGKFDFHFLLKYVDNPILCIKTRIVKAKLFEHELRDSYAILPVPLRDFEKQEFDYALMERPVREKNKAAILHYLHSDCVNLHTMVSAFLERFGPRMTIGGTAIRKLQEFHPFAFQGSRHDAYFRPYYFGGRVQCFAGGILRGPFKTFDVNSMYPYVMKDRLHPVNGAFDICSKIPDNFDMPFFVHFEGENRNALPVKSDAGSLVFDRPRGDFYACSHELEVALRHGLIDIKKVHSVAVACEAISFGDYVDTYYAEKADCKARGDKIGELFAKLLLNSAYGRTGINPENFADWVIWRDFGNEEELEDEGYSQAADLEEFELWSRPTEPSENAYCDVSIAASITSAARSVLLEGLQHCERPIYCDTDAIICADFHGDTDALRLGAWDLEKESEFVAIAGKKLYAMYNAEHIALDGPKGPKDKGFKLSSKGGTLKLSDIRKMCEGGEVEYHNDAPTFSLRLPPKFVSRKFVSTLELDEEAA